MLKFPKRMGEPGGILVLLLSVYFFENQRPADNKFPFSTVIEIKTHSYGYYQKRQW
jgi:hypothetical protein